MEKNMLGEIHRLRQMTVAELREEWEHLYSEPTRSRNRDYLWRRLAWRVQELAPPGRPVRPPWTPIVTPMPNGSPRSPAFAALAVRLPAPFSPASITARRFESSPSRMASSGRGGATDRSPQSPRPSPARSGTGGSSSA